MPIWTKPRRRERLASWRGMDEVGGGGEGDGDADEASAGGGRGHVDGGPAADDDDDEGGVDGDAEGDEVAFEPTRLEAVGHHAGGAGGAGDAGGAEDDGGPNERGDALTQDEESGEGGEEGGGGGDGGEVGNAGEGEGLDVRREAGAEAEGVEEAAPAVRRVRVRLAPRRR